MAISLSVGLTAVALVPATPARAAEPAAAAGARHLSETEGGSPNDFELLNERSGAIEHSAGTLWAGKYLDHRTGRIHIVYRDAANGVVAGPQLRSERSEQATAGLPEGLVLGSASWLPPPDDGRLVLAYRAGDEEGSCRREVTVDARSGGVSVTESLDC